MGRTSPSEVIPWDCVVFQAGVVKLRLAEAVLALSAIFLLPLPVVLPTWDYSLWGRGCKQSCRRAVANPWCRPSSLVETSSPHPRAQVELVTHPGIKEAYVLLGAEQRGFPAGHMWGARGEDRINLPFPLLFYMHSNFYLSSISLLSIVTTTAVSLLPFIRQLGVRHCCTFHITLKIDP